jgi:hypothetical protein
MKNDRTPKLILVLILVIVLLLGFVGYMLLIRPAITGNAVRLQNEGIILAVDTIIQNVAPPQCGSIPLTTGDTVVNVIAVECIPQEILNQIG